MAISTAEKRAQFRKLHDAGCFVMPNFWDLGSARALAHLGFPALASSSSGFAWSNGRADNGMGLEPVLAHLAAVAAGVDLPVNADFENGHADRPDDVAANVAKAVETGVAGLSIEDYTRNPDDPLYDRVLAVARIRAARAAIDRIDPSVVLTARAEGFIVGRPDMAETIARLQAYAAAGADCLFAPGMASPGQAAAIVAAVAPKPVNLLIGSPTFTVAQAAELGVRRISVGGALARAAWGGFLAAAAEIATSGTFAGLAGTATFSGLNAMFAKDDVTGT
jgi:2-methylisocitrate lyase-like PEP mutase family enzyme